MSDTVNINNKKSLKPLSPNGLSQVRGGGSEPLLTHNKVDCAYLPNEINSCANRVNELCENDKLSLAKSSPHPNPLPRRGNRRNITSSPSGANFDGHAESQTQCPCEGLTIQGAHSAEQTIKYRLREEVKIQDRGKQPYEQQRITDAGEGWQYRSCEESTVDIQRDSCLRCRRGTSRTYQDARRVRSLHSLRMTNNPPSPPQAGVRT